MEPMQLRGRIVDLDSHLMLLPRTLQAILGDAYQDNEVVERMNEVGLDASGEGPAMAASRAKARTDVWNVKGWGAHGAQIATDRVDALDQMGIARQLLFPGGIGPAMHRSGPEAEEAVSRYNDFAIGWAAETDRRVVPVCALNSMSLDAMLTEARRVIDLGSRVVLMTSACPPGGGSLAGHAYDEFWATLSGAGVSVVLHPLAAGGAPGTQVVNPAWSRAGMQLGLPTDDSVDDMRTWPYTWMTAHLPAEILLTFLVLGGVFDRHPNLVVGAVEMGASWVRSWCSRMDRLAATTCAHLADQLILTPSEYVRRNIKVTPYVYEDVGSWISELQLQDVYAFSTDYPHMEGGTNPIGDFEASLACAGDSALEGFFVTNGSALLPA